MTFTAIYRDAATGIKRSICVDAVTRTAAFKMLDGRGIHPLSIREGGVATSSTVSGYRWPWIVVAIGFLTVLAVCLIGWFGRNPSGVPHHVTEHLKPTHTVKSVSPVRVTERTESESSRRSVAIQKVISPPTALQGDNMPPSVVQSKDDASSSPPDSGSSGKPVLFRRGTDQLIAMAIFQPRNAPMPPFPGMSREDTDAFVTSLSEPIVLPEDAPETLKRMRQAVLETRIEIAAALKADPDTSLAAILEGHRRLHNENVDIRAQAQRELEALVQHGDEAAVKKYMEEVNPVLRELGIAEVTLDDDEDEETSTADTP